MALPIRYYNRFVLPLFFSMGLLLTLATPSFSQEKLDSIFNKLDPQQYAESVQKKATKIEEKLIEKSMKVLSGMQKQEEKIYRKLVATKDSLAAKAKLLEIKDKYAGLKNKIKKPAVIGKVSHYIPTLDSLSTSLKFLDQNGIGGKVKEALAKTTSLQDKFQQAEEIKKFIRERREQLKQSLEKLGMVKQLKQINKQVYYYTAQIKEYKEVLKDPAKIEKKALELLSKTKFFKDFMKKNSLLASLMGYPQDISGASGAAVDLTGLQARVEINQLIQQQVAAGGRNFQQLVQQNSPGPSLMQQWKDKVTNGIGSAGDDDKEGFKPNDQKTKPFLKRFELGGNLQTQKASYYFPVTSDLAFSVGYKLNDKSIVGLGASFKLGLGRGWNNIQFTGQGIGLRSFIDWKIKGNFYITGGYEQNYRTEFNNIDVLSNRSAWQQSGLIGLSKKYKATRKLNGKMQLLWDFMSYQQIPRTQAIIFRIGFSKK